MKGGFLKKREKVQQYNISIKGRREKDKPKTINIL